MADDTGAAPTKAAEELQRELDALAKSHNNLTTAHEKLKDDLRSMKASQSDAAELTKQIERLHSEKARLLTEGEGLRSEFEAFRRDAQRKDLRATLARELEAVTKSPGTVLKLLDLDAIELDELGQPKKDSLAEAVAALRETDPFLFAEAPQGARTPPVKAALDRQVQSGYETEVAAAVRNGSQRELEEVYAKYHQS